MGNCEKKFTLLKGMLWDVERRMLQTQDNFENNYYETSRHT